MYSFPALLAAAVFLAGCSKSNGGSSDKLSEREEDKEAFHVIRVLTYNIQHGNITSGKIDLDLYAHIIREQKPDLVALQEVDKYTRRTGNLDITAELSRLTGMEGYFGKYRDYGGGEYGDAILSRMPVLDFSVSPAFYTPEGRKRTYSFAKIEIDDSTYIHFNTSHLTPYVQSEKVKQAEELVRFYEDSLNRAPLLIAGDLNAEPHSEPINVLLNLFAMSDSTHGNTFSTRSKLTKKIDYILYPDNDHWKVFETDVICRGDASDHCAVLAELGFRKNN